MKELLMNMPHYTTRPYILTKLSIVDVVEEGHGADRNLEEGCNASLLGKHVLRKEISVRKVVTHWLKRVQQC